MPVELYQVDAFVTDRPSSGNPAGVCILENPADEGWMQSIARKMNFSETAFLVKRPHGYQLRWFTPAVEIDLCGHATLASAHILWEKNLLRQDEPAVFYTKSGTLTASQREEMIELDFPATPEEPAEIPPELKRALGVKPVYSGRSVFDYLVEVEHEEIVRAMKPDFELLKTIPVRGVIVTSKASTHPYDFVSRFFGPYAGIDEDPVTGSAHCCLGPFWMKRLKKHEFTAYQASPRGGLLRVRVGKERVYLGGKAVMVERKELH